MVKSFRWFRWDCPILWFPGLWPMAMSPRALEGTSPRPWPNPNFRPVLLRTKNGQNHPYEGQETQADAVEKSKVRCVLKLKIFTNWTTIPHLWKKQQIPEVSGGFRKFQPILRDHMVWGRWLLKHPFCRGPGDANRGWDKDRPLKKDGKGKGKVYYIIISMLCRMSYVCYIYISVLHVNLILLKIAEREGNVERCNLLCLVDSRLYHILSTPGYHQSLRQTFPKWWAAQLLKVSKWMWWC